MLHITISWFASTVQRALFRRTFPVVAGSCVASLWLAVALDVRVVTGDSMQPSLSGGDIVLVNRLAYGVGVGGRYLVRWSTPRVDHVLALRLAGDGPLLVKRCASADGAVCDVRGDNVASSQDSRTFGAIPVDDVIGRVFHLW